MRFLFLALFVILVLGGVLATDVFAVSDLVIANFEVWENNVNGKVGVYGSLEPNWNNASEPYSWIYDKSIKDTQNYSNKNIHKGRKSYRLVNATGAKPGEKWGSLSIGLGPVIDKSASPVIIEPLDVSNYKYLKFWLKGEKGGERIAVGLRDSHAGDYLSQYTSKRITATKVWKKASIPLLKAKKKVELKKLVDVSVMFGSEQGNKPGATIYLDDFAFSTLP